MYTLSYWNDLQNWKRIAQSCFGYGNHITASRFHILKKMIDWRIEFVTRHLNFPGVQNDENVETMLALSRICEFAGEVTNGEQQILLHTFIGICQEELQKEDVKGSLAWKRGNLYLTNDLESKPEEANGGADNEFDPEAEARILMGENFTDSPEQHAKDFGAYSDI